MAETHQGGRHEIGSGGWLLGKLKWVHEFGPKIFEPQEPLIERQRIAALHGSRIVERVYRVDPARSREAGGLGLGLAIDKRAAKAHVTGVRLTALPWHALEVRLFPMSESPVCLNWPRKSANWRHEAHRYPAAAARVVRAGVCVDP